MSLRSLKLTIVCLGWIVIHSGCGEKSVPPPVADITPPTEKETEAFLVAFDQAVVRKDPAAIQRMVDWTTLMQEVTSNLHASVATRKKFLAEVQKGFDRGEGFGGQLVEALQQGGSYQLVDMGAEYASVTFRLLMSDDEKSDYHELKLQTRDEKTRLTDLYIYSSGEPLSRSLRRSFLLFLKTEQPELISKLTGWEADFLDAEDIITGLYQASNDRDWLAVHALYEQLPATLQQDAQLWMLVAKATSRMQRLQQLVSEIQAGELQQAEALYDQIPADINQDKVKLTAYLQTVARQELSFPAIVKSYREQHDKPACVDFLMRGRFLELHDFAGALKCVDRFQQAVPEDAYPLVMRAQILNAQKKTGEARQAALAAIKKDNTLEAAHWSLVKSSLIDKTWPETVRHLSILQQQFHQPLTNIHLLPEFEAFIQSPAFREWQNPLLRANSN